MAIIVTDDGPDQLFTYDCALTFEETEKVFDVWENSYKYKIAAKWIDVDNDGVREKSFKRVNLEAVKELWEQFGDVPMNPETECIEACWEVGCGVIISVRVLTEKRFGIGLKILLALALRKI